MHEELHRQLIIRTKKEIQILMRVFTHLFPTVPLSPSNLLISCCNLTGWLIYIYIYIHTLNYMDKQQRRVKRKTLAN